MMDMASSTERRQRPRTSDQLLSELSDTYLKNDAALRFVQRQLGEGDTQAASEALDVVIAQLPGNWELRANYLAELRRELDELRSSLSAPN